MIACVMISSNTSNIVTLPRFGPRIVITIGMALGFLGLAYLSRLDVDSSYAGGVLLAQICDLGGAADTARFAISEVKVGRGSPWAAPLSWLVPPRIALQILLTGDPLSAQRAYEVGLINEVVEPAALVPTVQALAERIAANAPLSVAAAKRTAYLSRSLDMDAAFTEAERIWDPVYRSADAQEGPAAFRDKRTPVWTGR